MSDPVASTPGRSTLLFLDPPRFNAARQSICIPRSGDQIGEESHWQGRESVGVQYLADRTWALQRKFQSWETAAFSSSEFLTTSDGQLVPNGAMYFSARTPLDLPGVTAPGYAAQSVPMFTKVVAYGESFDKALAADEANQLTRATALSETVPMNRVFVGNKTYAANQGFVFLFRVPPGTGGHDWLYSFYFGGPSDATFIPGAESTMQGMFCVAFRGDGTAALYTIGFLEGIGADSWAKRFEFRYSAPTRAAEGWHWCVVLPFKNNRIIFQHLQADAAPSGGAGLFDDLKLGSKKLPVNTVIYKHSIAQTGHRFNVNICGAGVVRVDARSDLRWHFSIAKEGWKTSGTLYDAPLSLPRVLPAGTVLSILGDSDIPTGGHLVATLHRADTGAALAAGPALGDFLSVSGVREYFASFAFSGDGKSTPLLRSYAVQVEASIQLSAPSMQRGDYLQSLSATSGTTDPSTDTAHVLLEDPAGDASRLSQRARIPAQLRTYADDGVTYSVLFDGEVARAGAARRYAETAAIPGIGSIANWRAYDTLLVGAWARLYDKRAIGSPSYAQDFNADKLPDGTRPPWRVTDVIRDLFVRAGWPTEQLDIPNIELRLFPSEGGIHAPGMVIPQTNARYAEAIQQLARLYLDAFIVWDPNAGNYGMWRLILAPQQPYLGSLLWDFVLTDAGDAPGPIQHPGRYGAEQTFVLRETLQEWVQAPECNHVIVWCPAEQKGSTQHKYHNELLNYRSYDPDPAHPTADITSPDYLGYELTLLWSDPMLQSQQACDFICRRLFDAAAYGRIWCSWSAPLVLLTNPFDALQTRPRPLRLGDVVRVNGRTTMIRSCALEIDRNRGGDAHQTGHYQGAYLD